MYSGEYSIGNVVTVKILILLCHRYIQGYNKISGSMNVVEGQQGTENNCDVNILHNSKY